MDPLTLFALANGAVSAVKAGCKLYKEIKGAAGDVKDVLKDLDEQFHKLYEGKPVPPAAKKQLQEEKTRVVELNKKAEANEHGGLYHEIGEHLGMYFDNLHKCITVFEEEERRSKTQVYTGDVSLGKRALQRVLMRKQLEQMGSELQELMIYQSPPELGALWTEVNDMMNKMGEQQKVLIVSQMKRQEIEAKRVAAKKTKMNEQALIGMGIMVVIMVMGFLFMWVAWDRQQKYPQYGKELFPKSERERREEAEPKVYVGR
jgi:hypothetical protein